MRKFYRIAKRRKVIRHASGCYIGRKHDFRDINERKHEVGSQASFPPKLAWKSLFQRS